MYGQGQGYAAPGGYAAPSGGYAAPGGYAVPGGYAPAASAGGYGGPPYGGAVRQSAPPSLDDMERTVRTVHVCGIRGLKGQPGIEPGEEITEDDLASFFGNDGEVVGVRIFGGQCWIEFADPGGANSALMKDGTESGGHNLRVSASRTPIRSNGYAAGRAKVMDNQAALGGGGGQFGGQGLAASGPWLVSAADAPDGAEHNTQMTPTEIVDAVNADLCRAIADARARGTLV